MWQSGYGVYTVLMLRGLRVHSCETMVQHMCCLLRQTPPLSKRTPHFLTYKRSLNEHKLGHVSWLGLKTRTTLPARPSRNLLDWSGSQRLAVISCMRAEAVQGWPWRISIVSNRYLATTSNSKIKNRRLYVCSSYSDLYNVQISETVTVICS
jgi:hypothetical protein